MALLLVIDEDKDSSGFIKRVLGRHGHKVAAFGKAEDALLWLNAHKPNLVIVSAGKHGEKASELLSMLNRAGIQGHNILLSANESSLGPVRKAFSGEVRGIVVKASVEKLEEMVRSWEEPESLKS